MRQWALRRTVGPWSAGTRVDLFGEEGVPGELWAKLLNKDVVIPVTFEDLIELRNRDGLTKKQRGKEVTQEPPQDAGQMSRIVH